VFRDSGVERFVGFVATSEDEQIASLDESLDGSQHGLFSKPALGVDRPLARPSDLDFVVDEVRYSPQNQAVIAPSLRILRNSHEGVVTQNTPDPKSERLHGPREVEADEDKQGRTLTMQSNRI